MLRVIGDVLFISSHCIIADFSKEFPSESMYGSRIMPPVMGHKYAAGIEIKDIAMVVFAFFPIYHEAYGNSSDRIVRVSHRKLIAIVSSMVHRVFASL